MSYRFEPKSLARRALKKLPFPVLYEIFYQSARALDIAGYQVLGDSGIFVGPLQDQAVIREYLKAKTFSPIILRLFKDFFEARNGGEFFDLGANIGMVTVPIAQNAKVHCTSFEPDPRNFALLRANVGLNCRHDNVELVNAAVADRRGQLRFAESEYNSGDHRISADGALLVEAVRLDDFPPRKMPLAVKIDCQGAEPLIVAGGAGALATADLVVCEFWPWGIRRMGLSPEPMLRFVGSFGGAQVLRHDEAPGRQLPVAEAIHKMQRLIEDGGEFAQADLVLTRG